MNGTFVVTAIVILSIFFYRRFCPPYAKINETIYHTYLLLYSITYLCMCLPACLSACLACLPFCPFASLFTYLPTYLPFYLPTYLPTNLPVRPIVRLPARPFARFFERAVFLQGYDATHAEKVAVPSRGIKFDRPSISSSFQHLVSLSRTGNEWQTRFTKLLEQIVASEN